MSALRRVIMRQFARPSGALGKLAGLIMANRPSNRQRNEWGVALLNPVDGEHLLELGSGPGYALAYCARRHPAVSLVGLDHSALMVHEARQRVGRLAPGSEVWVEEGGLERLAEWPGRFDGVWSANVVQFFPDLPAAFSAISGVLKPGGRVVSVYQPRHKSPTRADALAKAAQISDAMRIAGFEAILSELLELKPVPAVAVLGRKPG